MSVEATSQNEKSALWRAAMLYGGGCLFLALGYGLFFITVSLAERMGSAAGVSGGGVVGTALSAGLLLIAVWRLARRGPQLVLPLGGLLFALLILTFAWLGELCGHPNLGIVGLLLDIGLLGWAIYRLHHRGSGLASTLGPLVALLAIIALFALAEAGRNFMWPADARVFFWSIDNFRSMAIQSSAVAMAALGMTLIIIAGGIDLSVGTAISLSATVLAWGLLHFGITGIYFAIISCLLVGVGCGLLNGGLISFLRVVPFIVTLGTMTIFLGMGNMLANETRVTPPPASKPEWIAAMVKQLPEPTWLAWPVVPNVGFGVWLVFVAAAALAVLLHLTVFGRHVFALGSNETTARLCGINVTRAKLLVYAVAGIFVGLAGILHFANMGQGDPMTGPGMELKVIAAVVIGGGSLNGGRGSVVGTLSGAAVMSVLGSGCTALGLSNPIQNIIIGVIIVAAVTLDQLRQRRLAAA